MKKKRTAADQLGGLSSESSLEVTRELVRLSRRTAKALAPRFSELAKSEVAQRKVGGSSIAVLLEEELFLFALKASRVLAKSDAIRSLVSSLAVRPSAAKRSQDSRKAHLLDWARRERELNPGESKASLARRYLNSHAGINITLETAKRYLSRDLV
ncbi:hypothetical protein K3217_25825 [bacterium BD-1]|nr:hypothetical protein [Ottowia caeni]